MLKIIWLFRCYLYKKCLYWEFDDFLVFVSHIVYNFYLNGDKYLLCLIKKIDNLKQGFS